MMQQAVTVIIPTSGRKQVAAAVGSALDQTGVDVEVIVIDNSPTSPSPVLRSLPESVRLLRSPPEDRANGARQLGIQHATHPLVALLDDDDTWQPTKLTHQLAFCADLGLSIHQRWVVSCGIHILRDEGVPLLAPARFPEGPICPEHYLFRRDTLTDQHRQLQTSTLLFPKALALDVPFEASQRFHQDWTWLLNVVRSGGEIHQAPEYLVTYRHNSAGSITSASRCGDSIEWANLHLAHSSRVRGDFILTVPFNMATTARDRGWQWRSFLTAMRTSRPGPFSTLRAVAVLIVASVRPKA